MITKIKTPMSLKSNLAILSVKYSSNPNPIKIIVIRRK
jgi:hypothetical protein